MSSDEDLERLFREQFGRLVHAVAVVLGDTDEASDIVQDAFVQARRHWTRVRAYDERAAWLRRVALNRALNERRRSRRRQVAIERLSRASSTLQEEPAFDFDSALRRLPPQQRAVTALFYVIDLPIAAIADQLAIAEGTVKSHLSDARRALAPQLEVDDGSR